MHPKLKQLAKKIIYPSIEWLDTTMPHVSTWLVRRFYRYRALNDLHLSSSYSYDPLGTYVTLYQTPPSFYRRFLKSYHFDENGIPVNLHENSYYYNGVSISQYGLAEYGYYLTTKQEIHRKNCLSAAKGMLRLQDKNGGWPNSIDFFHVQINRTLKSGWYSAMAQGQAISLFVRAYSLEPDPAYVTAAHQALSLLEIPVDHGGLLSKIGNLDFYEEYPTVPSSFTLNGLIFCMIGLYDGSQVFHDKDAYQMFRKMSQTVKTILPLYDGDKLSSYDLCHITNPARNRLCNRKYHILHCKLLQALNSIQHDEVLSFYIQKWGKHWR